MAQVSILPFMLFGLIRCCLAAPNELATQKSIKVVPFRYSNNDPVHAQELLRTRNLEIRLKVPPSPIEKSGQVANSPFAAQDAAIAMQQITSLLPKFSGVTLRDNAGHVWKAGQSGFQFNTQGGGSLDPKGVSQIYTSFTLPTPLPAGDLTLSLDTSSRKNTLWAHFETLVRPVWESLKPKLLAIQTLRLIRLQNPDPRAGKLAVAVRFIYTGQKPLWAVDEPLPSASFKEHWAPLKSLPAPAKFVSLIVGQRYWLQNERGELLEDHYPYHLQAAIYARRPTLQKDGSIEMLFPLNPTSIPFPSEQLQRYQRPLRPFKHAYFYTEIGVEGDGILPVRWEIPLATLRSERQKPRLKR